MAYLGKRLKRAVSKDAPGEDLKVRAGYTWLLRQFSKQRTSHYRDALAQWQRWESKGFLDELKSIMK